MVNKILNIRVFEDEQGTMWKKGVKELGLEVLCGKVYRNRDTTTPSCHLIHSFLVSQFTLQAKTVKGNLTPFLILLGIPVHACIKLCHIR